MPNNNIIDTQEVVNSTVAIAIVDESDKHIHSSPNFCRMLGYTSSEFFAMTAEQVLQLIHPEDRPATDELLKQLANHEIEEFTEQQRLIRKDGTIIWVNKTVKTSWDNHGNRIVAVVTLEEI